MTLDNETYLNRCQDDIAVAEKSAILSPPKEDDDSLTLLDGSLWLHRAWSNSNKTNNEKRTNINFFVLFLIAVVAFGLGVSATIAWQVFLSTTVSVDPRQVANDPLEVVHRFRLDVANSAIDIMESDTVKEAAKSPLVDIGPFVDVVSSGLDVLGVRGVFRAFRQIQLVVAFNDAALQRRISQSFGLSLHGGDIETKLATSYRGIPNDRLHPEITHCTGCIWWLQHWLGAILADKLMREGMLRLGDENDSLIRDATSLYKEIHKMQYEPFPELVHQNAQHGFAWQYMMTTRPGMDAFPSDIMEELCGDYIIENEFLKETRVYLDRTCRHGVGHGAFYVVANRQFAGNLTVRSQFRPAVGFKLKEENFCDAMQICAGAPTRLLEYECISGIKHSSYLFDSGKPEDSMVSDDVLKARCGIETREIND